MTDNRQTGDGTSSAQRGPMLVNTCGACTYRVAGIKCAQCWYDTRYPRILPTNGLTPDWCPYLPHDGAAKETP